MSEFQDNAVFFIEVDKIEPNPYQPRKEFDEEKLNDLAGSIRMYGILQPLTVIRKEYEKEDGGIGVKYELIAGERRLRASKIAGLREVPALIRTKEDDSRVKLELAIIENLQREDLSPVDRARSFQQLAEEFGLKHIEIAKKVGKSREYVSNTMRLLALSDEILTALNQKKISEGHTRPLLMLSDRPEEQMVLFKEIMLKKMTVRDAEKIARKVAFDKVRKKERMFDPDIVEMEQEASEHLGTRVHIEPKEVGGRIQIDYFNEDDLKNILKVLNQVKEEQFVGMSEQFTDNSAQQQDMLEQAAPIVFAQPQQKEESYLPEEEVSVTEVMAEPNIVLRAEHNDAFVTQDKQVVFEQSLERDALPGVPDYSQSDAPQVQESVAEAAPESPSNPEKENRPTYSLNNFSI